ARGHGEGYFRLEIETGSHAASIAAVVQGAVDTAAIDSTVLDHAQLTDPDLCKRLRVIASLGPYTAPPIACASSLPDSVRARLRLAFLGIHEDQAVAAGLAAAGVLRYVAVVDSDYDAIRRTADEGFSVGGTQGH